MDVQSITCIQMYILHLCTTVLNKTKDHPEIWPAGMDRLLIVGRIAVAVEWIEIIVRRATRAANDWLVQFHFLNQTQETRSLRSSFNGANFKEFSLLSMPHLLPQMRSTSFPVNLANFFNGGWWSERRQSWQACSSIYWRSCCIYFWELVDGWGSVANFLLPFGPWHLDYQLQRWVDLFIWNCAMSQNRCAGWNAFPLTITMIIVTIIVIIVINITPTSILRTVRTCSCTIKTLILAIIIIIIITLLRGPRDAELGSCRKRKLLYY